MALVTEVRAELQEKGAEVAVEAVNVKLVDYGGRAHDPRKRDARLRIAAALGVALALVLILVAAFAGQLSRWRKQWRSHVGPFPAAEKKQPATSDEIALSEARQSGAKIPKKGAAKKKSSGASKKKSSGGAKKKSSSSRNRS